RESEARYEILLENYYKKIQIEARVIGEIVNSLIAPAVFNYQMDLVNNIKGLKELGLDPETYTAQVALIQRLSKHIKTIVSDTDAMSQERKKANVLGEAREIAIAYEEKVKPYFDKIRYHINKLEQVIDDKKWPLPKLRELLFIH